MTIYEHQDLNPKSVPVPDVQNGIRPKMSGLDRIRNRHPLGGHRLLCKILYMQIRPWDILHAVLLIYQKLATFLTVT
jgi:hypothetical protein